LYSQSRTTFEEAGWLLLAQEIAAIGPGYRVFTTDGHFHASHIHGREAFEVLP
jgi:hypothetical protein